MRVALAFSLALFSGAFCAQAEDNEAFKPLEHPEFEQVFQVALNLYGNNFRISSVLRLCGYKELSISILPGSIESLGAILLSSKKQGLLLSLDPLNAGDIYKASRDSLFVYAMGFSDGVSLGKEAPQDVCDVALRQAAEIMDKRAK